MIPRLIPDNWEISIGLYPGVLVGMRSYIEKDFAQHVFYIPFVDLCITIDKEDYLSGTDFRDEQKVLDNALIEQLKINQNQLLNNASKSDLTKSLTIESVQNFDKFGYK